MRWEGFATSGTGYVASGAVTAAAYLLERLAGADPLWAAAVAAGVFAGSLALSRSLDRRFWADYFLFPPSEKVLVRHLKRTAASVGLCFVGTALGWAVLRDEGFFRPLGALVAGAAGLALAQAGYRTPQVFLRGRRRIRMKEAAEKADALRHPGDPGIPFGGVRLPWSAKQFHFLLIGSARSGKTTLIEGMLGAMLPLVGRARGVRALIADPKAENLSRVVAVAPHARVVTANAFDDPAASVGNVLRGAAYHMARDLDSIASACTYAKGLVPDNPQAKEPVWELAYRP
jgi:hypothetical protein